MSLAIRSLYFLGLLTVLFPKDISLHACTQQDIDSPLELLQADFYSDQNGTIPQALQQTNTSPTELGIPNWMDSAPNRHYQRLVPASLTNWSNETQTLIPADPYEQPEFVPPQVDDPVYAHPNEWIEPRLDIESTTPEFRVNGYPNEQRPRPMLFRRGPLRKMLRRQLQTDFGLGFERIPYAPLVLDTPLTSPYMGFRVRADRGMNAPDRLEYLWGKAGSGPAPESRVDLIDTIYRTELGNEKAGFISEMRMRSLDPTINGNTVGFGDMLVGGKLLVYNSNCTKVSTIFLTHLNTGPERRGLGRGHVALEPGMLAMRKWNERTYLFGEWKYHLPLGATLGFSGDVFKTGWGVATIWHDTDRYAMIPTLEIQTHSFLFGGRTLPDGTEVRVDGTTAVDLYPGVRWTFNKSAMGAYELGVSGGISVADRDWFDSRMIFELRWLR
ncbi:MAG: hypothetical protein MUC83_06080 [Pirellula sp.]|nr:hypothetical protein [Pirellula sp.]